MSLQGRTSLTLTSSFTSSFTSFFIYFCDFLLRDNQTRENKHTLHPKQLYRHPLSHRRYTYSAKLAGSGTLPICVPIMAITAVVPKYPKGDDTTDFGDFVSTEDEELDLEEVVEPWQKYDIKESSHVFYPIRVGEVLEERYLIEHKIGFGGLSTVWMAHDLQNKRDVALKVLSSAQEWGENETRMQNEILQNVQDTSHLVTYLATFLLPGNKCQCQHRVLVLPLMGPCLDPVIRRKLSKVTRLSAAKQLLEALENLHKAGIVHRGERTTSHFLSC